MVARSLVLTSQLLFLQSMNNRGAESFLLAESDPFKQRSQTPDPWPELSHMATVSCKRGWETPLTLGGSGPV